ncbi:DUF2089 domain-containing protein [Candidatus Poribacteria bacterium]
MRKPLSQCPICGGQLEPVKLKCSSCDVALEGRLPASRLTLLSPDQQQFVEVFLVARGNIKEVEKELGISYPTVRKKLDEIAHALGYASQTERMEREEILDAIDRGEISAKEGIALLKGGGSK